MSAEATPIPSQQMSPPPQMRPLGPLIIPERKEYVPEWCPWRAVTEAAWRGDAEAHQKLCDTIVWHGDSEPVVSNGVTVTVAHVLPERRWVIRADGRLKDVPEVNLQHETKYVGMFTIAGQRQSGDPGAIPKPHPLEFVKWTADPANSKKRVRIGADPLKPAPLGAKPRTAEDAAEDPVAQASGGLLHRPDGVTHREQSETPAQKLELLNALRTGGALNEQEYATGMRKIAEEAGWASSESGGSSGPDASTHSASPSIGQPSSAPPRASSSSLASGLSPPEPAPSAPAAFSAKTQCGKELPKTYASEKRAEQAARMHARRCRECIATTASSEA